MSQTLFIKYLRLLAFATMALLSHVSAQAQVADSLNVKHVRLDVARMGLHCPFLGPKLVQKLKEVPSAQNVKMFMMESYITFELPVSSTVVGGKIKDIAVLVGYPAQDITVTVDQ
jgi:hypothetical protein